MYYEPKISTNRQAGKTQQMFYELSIELSKKQQELDQYKNNWEELKKMFETDEHFEDGCYCGEILNKMKELEEKNND